MSPGARLSQGFQRATIFAIDALGKTPTTNLRIVVTLALFVGTGVVTLATDNMPGGWDWAIVLMVMAGMDVGAFIGKRATHKEFRAANGTTTVATENR